jgi:hypothetical protein
LAHGLVAAVDEDPPVSSVARLEADQAERAWLGFDIGALGQAARSDEEGPV